MPATSPPPYKGGGLRPPPQRGAAAFGGRPPLWIPWYGGWGGGRHSIHIQMYQQICIEYVYWCIYLPYSFGIPIISIIPYPFTSLCPDNTLWLGSPFKSEYMSFIKVCIGILLYRFLSDFSPKWSGKVPTGVTMGENYSQTPHGDFWTDSGTNFCFNKQPKSWKRPAAGKPIFSGK